VTLTGLGQRLRPALIAGGVGALVSGAYAIPTFPHGFVRILYIGFVIGVCIYACTILLHALLGRQLERLGPGLRGVVRVLVFVISGIIGGPIGIVIAVWLSGYPISLSEIVVGRGRAFMAMAAVVALVAGLSFRAFEALRKRLADTAAQLKEAEWAEKEIELARSIQTRLLPPPLVETEQFTIAARNLAARYVAGDFYDIVRLEDGSVVVAVADVAGKGLGASLIMASVKAVLPFVAREGAQQAMATLNAKLVRELDRREFVAMALARFTPHDGALELLNAGFPDPYLVSRNGVHALAAGGPRLPLGLRRDIAYEPLRAQLARGDRVLFVSDGIPEAPAHGEPLGYERLARILESLDGSARGAEWLDAFLREVRNVVDERLDDDWTAVVLERA
jgi:serine phosphatase RsbU (regulator of sigma subunit)